MPWFSRIETMATPLAKPIQTSQVTGGCRSWSPRSWSPGQLLRSWHLASLDAPTVGVVWGWAFAWTAHIQLAGWPLALLGLVVWVVYVGDRLLDARAGRELRERHHFHWRHRRVLIPLAGGAGFAAAAMVRRWVPVIALPQDSAVALATLAYFSGVHGRLRLPAAVARLTALVGWRECLVGTLFAAGCVLPAWSVDPLAFPVRLVILPAGYFAAVAWLNVRAITRWESGRLLGRVAWALAAVGMMLGLGLAMVLPRAATLIAAAAVSALLIGWLDRRRERLDPVTLRAAVDLVLLTPVLLVGVR